jgi:hypothetical protein
MKFTANAKFSYFIDLVVRLDGTDIVSENRVNLHDQVTYNDVALNWLFVLIIVLFWQVYHYLNNPIYEN